MSQKDHKTRVKKKLQSLQEEFDWYDKELTAWKSIEPGCNNTTNLQRRLEAWKNIVPNCDTPQKLEKYVRKLENSLGVERPEKPLEEGLKYTEYWNEYFVPYCRERDIPIFEFTESRFIQEREIFLEDIRSYGESNDPYHFLEFYKFLKERDVMIPYDVEEYL